MSYKRRKVMRALKEIGFEIDREGRRHTIMCRADGIEIAVPRKTELARGTDRGMCQDAGVQWNEFRKVIT